MRLLLSREHGNIRLEQRTETVSGIKDAVGSRRDRCGELGDLVDDEIRAEHREDGVEILEARWHLGTHEEVGEGQASDLGGGQAGADVAMVKHHGIVAGKPRSERSDAGSPDDSEQRFSRGHGHVISRLHQRLDQRDHRVVVPIRRAAREQDAHRSTIRGSGIRRSCRCGSELGESSNSSWVNPHMRLPRACVT